MECVKEVFLDRCPGRFVGIPGINPKGSPEQKLETLHTARQWGFKGVKIHTPTAGYPNDWERCYPNLRDWGDWRERVRKG
jgi:predicted TIM-barrel fold metal-dependent hydrolase